MCCLTTVPLAFELEASALATGYECRLDGELMIGELYLVPALPVQADLKLVLILTKWCVKRNFRAKLACTKVMQMTKLQRFHF